MSKEFERKLAALLKARDKFSWMGASPPEDHAAITRSYHIKLKAVKDYVAEREHVVGPIKMPPMCAEEIAFHRRHGTITQEDTP